jgi:beta-galactosidase
MRVRRRILILVMFVSSVAAQAATQPRGIYNFNSDWKLKVGPQNHGEEVSLSDRDWKSITLPHAWNEDDAFAKPIRELSTGVAWYRKHFLLPAGSVGKRFVLEFEGIRQGGEFFLNGQPIGRSENGVMAFGFDITDLVKPGPAENVLAARIDNRWDYHEIATHSTFQWNDRNFFANYGGINKNVYLHVLDPLHQTLPLFCGLGTTGIYVYADRIDVPNRRATLTVESEIANDDGRDRTFVLQVDVKDMDGNTVKSFTAPQTTLSAGDVKILKASAELDDLHFWSWGYGYLYTVTTSIKSEAKIVNTVETRTGFRKTRFDHGMLTLNDQPMQIHGYAQRSTNEWPAVGSCVPPWVSDFSNAMMVRGNANLVRWMHVTPWKQDVESCDRVGLMEAMPAGDSEGDPNGRRWEQRIELMRDAIIYNRNNPSIIFYECGNHGISEDHMQQMKAVRDKYDPHGGRAIGAREMLNPDSVAEYGGEMLYINKSAGKPLWAMEFCRDECNRKFWDEFTPPYHNVPIENKFRKPDAGEKLSDLPPAYEYNRNQDSFAIEDVTRWYDFWRERPGTGERVSGGGVNIYFSDSNTHFRNVRNYRESGEVDPVRLPKDAYFADRIMWDGYVDTECPAATILGHWNYDPKTVKDIVIVSSAQKVELRLNGKSLGFGENSCRFLFTFKQIHWQPGVLQAVGYNAENSRVCTSELTTAGAPKSIRLTPRTGPAGFRADGADIAMVDVEVLDNNGERCPTALNTIHFKLDGPADWRGGIAEDDDRPDNYVLSKDLPVQCGINRVLIRSATSPGAITITASANGLESATVDLATSAVNQTNGLSEENLAEKLPSILDRPPAAAPAPIVASRHAIWITSATAGSNVEQAKRSFDDNETTNWSSDGKLADAWIEYQLKSPALLTQANLKLGGWRTKGYALRITVDGKAVFTGATPRSLGYVTLALKPTLGTSVRIALTTTTGPDKDDFDLVEVGSNTAPTTKAARGGLSIVEAEFYGSSENSEAKQSTPIGVAR